MHKIGDILDKSKKINRMSHLHAYQTHKKRVCTKKLFFDTPSSILIPRYYNSFDIRLIQAKRLFNCSNLIISFLKAYFIIGC